MATKGKSLRSKARAPRGGVATGLPRLIGVIHLPALAGAPGSSGLSPIEALQRAGLQAVREAQIFEQSGFGAIILENFGDIPFYRDRVPPETIASLAVIAGAVRESARIPVGINVLRNDARSALAVAAVTGCDFIRVNVLSGVVASDQGFLEGQAADLVRERARLGAGSVAILADILVKHARTLSSDDVELAAEEAVLRGQAEGVIVSGATTGRAVDPERLQQIARVASDLRVPFYVGSGASPDLLEALGQLGAGVIVSSSLRKDGRAGEPLDPKRVRDFAQLFARAAKRAAPRPVSAKTKTSARPTAAARVRARAPGKRKGR